MFSSISVFETSRPSPLRTMKSTGAAPKAEQLSSGARHGFAPRCCFSWRQAHTPMANRSEASTIAEAFS